MADFLLQRLSVAGQRGNAACVVDCTYDGTDVDFLYWEFAMPTC